MRFFVIKIITLVTLLKFCNSNKVDLPSDLLRGVNEKDDTEFENIYDDNHLLSSISSIFFDEKLSSDLSENVSSLTSEKPFSSSVKAAAVQNKSLEMDFSSNLLNEDSLSFLTELINDVAFKLTEGLDNSGNSNDHNGTHFEGCKIPCPERTLIVVYEYPEDMQNAQSLEDVIQQFVINAIDKLKIHEESNFRKISSDLIKRKNIKRRKLMKEELGDVKRLQRSLIFFDVIETISSLTTKSRILEAIDINDTPNYQDFDDVSKLLEIPNLRYIKPTYFSSLHMEAIELPEITDKQLLASILRASKSVKAVYEDTVLRAEPYYDPKLSEEQYFDEHVNNSDENSRINSFYSTDVYEAENETTIQRRILKSLHWPRDPFFSKQWSLRDDTSTAMNVVGVWDRYDDEEFDQIVIALIDSGVDLHHRDLKGRMWKNPDEICHNGIDDDNNGYIDDCYGWDFIRNEPLPIDENGHGTGVAGIIAAVPENNFGIAPICANCLLMNLKVLDSVLQGPTAGFVRAIDYALNKKIKISNNSYGAREHQHVALEEAIARARNAGMVFVAAAGNYASNNDDSSISVYPGSYAYDHIVSVAAINQKGEIAPFSNWGKQTVTLSAPGEGVFTTHLGNVYKYVSGTSFATPHVTALVALIWGKEPNLNYLEVVQRLIEGGTPLRSLQGKTQTGITINALRSLKIGDLGCPYGPQCSWPYRLINSGRSRVFYSR